MSDSVDISSRQESVDAMELVENPDSPSTGNNSIPESTLTLPLSRIKKIVKLDPEHITSSEGANYLIGKATELFIVALTEKASFAAKTDNRKKIQYKDFNSAVTNNDNLTFLSDLVPKTVPLRELIKKRMVKLSGTNAKVVKALGKLDTEEGNGNETIDGDDEIGDEPQDADMQEEDGNNSNENTIDERTIDEDDSMVGYSNNTPKSVKSKLAEEAANASNAPGTPSGKKRKPKVNPAVVVLPKGQRTLPFTKKVDNPSKKANVVNIINDSSTSPSPDPVEVSKEPTKVGVNSLLSTDDDVHNDDDGDVVMID